MHSLRDLTATLALALCLPIGVSAASSADSTSAIDGGLAPATCDYGVPHPNAPPELAQFDFLIGDYSVAMHAWRNGEWTPPRPGAPARWNGRYGLGGITIVDDWYDVDPGIELKGSRGTNVRMYDADAGEWDMMWIATAGHQVQDLRARIIEGKLTMWQVYPERAGFRAYFERLGPEQWQRISLVPGSGENEWVPQFKLVATRIACPAGSG